MILRKPYAFLIKHFKLIHIIITAFMAISLYRLFSVISFYGEYVLNESSVVGQYAENIVYPTIVFIAPIIVIIFSFILLGVMVVKHKPYKLYIFNIIVYVLYLVLVIVGNSTVAQLQKTLVDIRIIKLLRDFTTMMMIVQIYPLSKNFVRAVGFDIKQFDFKKDLAELEIKEEDNEEVEVTFSLDFNKLKRIINNGVRNFKYYYKEHKFSVNIIGSIIVIAIIGGTAFEIYNTNRSISYNQPLVMSGLNIKVSKTYVTRLDSNGNIIKNLGKNNSLIIVPITIKNNSTTKKELVTANIELRVDGNKYRHVSYYRDSIFDLGLTYQNNPIAKGETIKVNLVYEIPTKYIENNKKMTLKFITSIDESKKKLIPTYANLILDLINLDSNNKEYDINKNEEITLTDSVLGNTKLLIKDIEIYNRFKINYNLCVSTNNCISSYEYINPPLNSNIDRALMKVNGSITYDEEYKLSDLTYIYDLLSNFGSIKYKVNNTTKTIKTFNRVNPLATKSNNIIYISVPKDILEADSIDLYINIRNKEYKYAIK